MSLLLSPTTLFHSKSAAARAARAAATTARARQHSTAVSAAAASSSAAGTQWPVGLVFGPSNNNNNRGNDNDDDTNTNGNNIANSNVVGNFISITKSAQEEEGVAGGRRRNNNNNNNKNRIDRQRFQQDDHYYQKLQSPLSLSSLSSSSSPAGLNPYYSLQHYQNAGNDERRSSSIGSIRHYSTTQPSERAVAIVLGLASVSALAYAGSSAVQSYQEWKDAQPTEEERAEAAKKAAEEEAAAEEARLNQQADEEESASNSTQTNAKEEDAGPRENIFKQWFDVGTKYYEGGFEETMTKREAALILGVRESSSPQRIKDAHRKLLILNHPDTGGSTYLSGKLNEAKELLLKGKSSI